MKSVFKKLFALLLSVLVVAALFAPAAGAVQVKLNKSKIAVSVGETYKLKLSGAQKEPRWKSGDKNIVSVSKKGLIKGVKPGNATVSAKVGKKVYKCRVSVEAPRISSVKKIVPVGKSFALKLCGTKRNVKWSSSNRKIAMVTKNGIVKALSPGSVNIIAKVGKSRYPCRVVVRTGMPMDFARMAAPNLFVPSVQRADIAPPCRKFGF